MDDPYFLYRFVLAQDRDSTYDRVLEELRLGAKRSHWMWFVFPQIEGLGQSRTSRHYAISGLPEARAYLRHRVLGPRLIECTDLVATTPAVDATDIFGEIDALKLRSSMTLFMRAAPDEALFPRVLDHYFDGLPDPATDRRLRPAGIRAS
jgi:uncharacterized protein (DUF1810 family)